MTKKTNEKTAKKKAIKTSSSSFEYRDAMDEPESSEDDFENSSDSDAEWKKFSVVEKEDQEEEGEPEEIPAPRVYICKF